MITNYADLLVTAGEYVGRNDFSNVFQRFVGLAELKINRQLRVADMESHSRITLTDGAGALPDDFLEARSITTASGRVLRSMSLQALEAITGSSTTPQAFAIKGRNVIVRPIADSEINFDYYAKIPSLTLQNPTNWLLDSAPDIYLYGVVEEISIWSRDAAGATAAAEIKAQLLSGLRTDDERLRFGQNKVRIGGVTP